MIAGFALYRALLSQALKVPLHDDLATSGAVHPIRHFIREGFKRNKTDTSQRLVTIALSNGYKVGCNLFVFSSPQYLATSLHTDTPRSPRRCCC